MMTTLRSDSNFLKPLSAVKRVTSKCKAVAAITASAKASLYFFLNSIARF